MATQNPLSDPDNVSAAFFNAQNSALDGTAIESGCAPSVGAGNWDVDVAGGTVIHDETESSFNSDTTTLNSSDTSDRVDLVTIDNNGNLGNTTGTAASEPNAPDIPSNHVLVAAVYVRGGSSNLVSSDIFDYRCFINRGSGSGLSADLWDDHDTPNDIDGNEFSGGNGSAGQVLQSDGSDLNYVDDIWSFAFMGGGSALSGGHTSYQDEINFPRAHGGEWSRFNEGTFEATTTGDVSVRVRDITNGVTVAELNVSGAQVRNSTTSITVPGDGAVLALQWKSDDGSGVNIFSAGLTLRT